MMLQGLGYSLKATGGTAAYLQKQGLKVEPIFKIHEGRPNIEDSLRNGEITMVFLTPSGDAYDVQDGKNLRRLALGLKVGNLTPSLPMMPLWYFYLSLKRFSNQLLLPFKVLMAKEGNNLFSLKYFIMAVHTNGATTVVSTALNSIRRVFHRFTA